MTYHRISQLAQAAIIDTMYEGEAKYGTSSWVNRCNAEDVQHAIGHLHKLMMGDTSEPHLDHAMTRIACMKARPIAQLEAKVEAERAGKLGTGNYSL